MSRRFFGVFELNFRSDRYYEGPELQGADL